MSLIQSTTGHSPEKEKSIARILFALIFAAALIGGFIAYIAGKNDRGLNPFHSDNVNQAAPDAVSPAETNSPTSPQTNPPANQ